MIFNRAFNELTIERDATHVNRERREHRGPSIQRQTFDAGLITVEEITDR